MPKISHPTCTCTHVQCVIVLFTFLYVDGTRGFSKDQLKGKQPLPMFQPDALVVFRTKVKLGAKIEDD